MEWKSKKYKVKSKREFEWDFRFEIMPVIGFGIACGNTQSRKGYHSAAWDFIILFLCFQFNIHLSYLYLKTKPSK